MAVYHHGDRTIAYQIEFAPFMHDLLLLQSSRFSIDFWRPVLESMKQQTSSGGRVVVCDWHEKKLSKVQMAKDLDQLIKTIGLTGLHVVACDDAVDIVGELEKLHPRLFENTLLFPQSVPRAEDLSRSIREFSQT